MKIQQHSVPAFLETYKLHATRTNTSKDPCRLRYDELIDGLEDWNNRLAEGKAAAADGGETNGNGEPDKAKDAGEN